MNSLPQKDRSPSFSPSSSLTPPFKQSPQTSGYTSAKVGVLTAKDYGYEDDSPLQEPVYCCDEIDIPLKTGEDQYCATSSSRVTKKTLTRRSSMRQPGAPRRNSITPKAELEITIPPTKKGEGFQRVRRRTSLSFNDVAQVTTIEPAHSLTSKSDLWLQEGEMQEIRSKVVAIIRKTKEGSNNPRSGKQYCVRGLERLMNPEVTSLKRGVAWDAVLNEQYLQAKEGVFEDNHMATLYKFSSMRSQKDAAIQAMNDEKAVAKYLESTRRMCRRMSM
jgi:hypothetical protein